MRIPRPSHFAPSLPQVNYQYRHGIYADGGIPRFYRGVIPALAQGPLSRFGDTAANTGMLTLLDSFDVTRDLNVGYKTVAASVAAGLFRIVLMPVVRLAFSTWGVFAPFVSSFVCRYFRFSRARGKSPLVLHFFSHGIIRRPKKMKNKTTNDAYVI